MSHSLQRGFANRVRAWADRVGGGSIPVEYVVRGFAVDIVNSRSDISTAEVMERLDEALGLIEHHTPHYFRHMRHDFARILVRRYPCRGAFYPDQRTCLVELTFTVNPEFTTAQVASTILHEGMHARLHALNLTTDDRAREERFCRRAEVEFGKMVPNGDAVIARATESLTGSDEEVAPVIDWRVAAERIAEVDRKIAD